MVEKWVLDILACPACHAKVELVRDHWLVCQNAECRRKYPIRDDIPQMLIEEGDNYRDIAVEDLPAVS
ncbi:MAG TPA: Trm112 family protein [Anaerolineae bacterium]|nr:Trm112 family protein [Anaerolineae bacterium]HOQ99322.1 Trm112 family protein [Anaerolineae bacterium]HPL27668.1 Trm112 family protein [Anaerolineae bacterium]